MRASLLFVVLLFAACAAWPIPRGSFGPCDHPAPNDFEAVYACMSAYRTKNADGSVGPSQFARPQGFDCRELAGQYLRALTEEGQMAQTRARQYLPSCALFAQAVEKLTGEPPFWARCLDAKSGFDGGHFTACLDHFLPRYRRGGIRTRSLSALSTCKEAISAYERALRTADRGGNLPPGYNAPDCAAIAKVMAGVSPAWSAPSSVSAAPAGAPESASVSPALLMACLDYDPSQVKTHLRRCLGEDLSDLRDCPQVRRVYERKLTDAYGGSLPEGYTLLACAQAADVLRLADAQRAAKRAEEERQRAEAQRARNERARARAAERKRRELAAEQRRRETSHLVEPFPWWLFYFFLFLIVLAVIASFFRGKKIRPTLNVYGWAYDQVKPHLVRRSRKQDHDGLSDDW